jgi:hypothetical protein
MNGMNGMKSGQRTADVERTARARPSSGGRGKMADMDMDMDGMEMPPMDLGPDGPRAPKPAQEPGLWEAFLSWLMDQGASPQNVTEEAHKALPNALSARPGIEEDRRRKADIDRFMSEANQ